MLYRLRNLASGFLPKGIGGGSALFAGLMLANLIGYLYQMTMARMMSPATYGVLVTLTSISYVLAVLMRTFQAWIIETTSRARSASEDEEAVSRSTRAIFMAAIRTLAPLGVLALVLHWLLSGWGAGFLKLESPVPLIVLGVFTLSSFLVPVPRGVLMGLNHLFLAAFILAIEPLVRLVTGVGLVWSGLGVNGAILGFAIANFAAFGLALVFLLSRLRRKPGAEAQEAHSTSERALRPLDRYSLLVLAANTCLMLMASIDQIAVKHYFTDEVAGQYGVAFLLGRVIVMVAIALGWVVFTRSATMQAGTLVRTRLLVRALTLVGATGAAMTAGYLLVPELAVRLMGGADYKAATGYVGLVGIEMTLFALIYTQAYFLFSLRKLQVLWPLSMAAVLEVVALATFHDTVVQVLIGLIAVMAALLAAVSTLSWWLLRAGSQAEARSQVSAATTAPAPVTPESPKLGQISQVPQPSVAGDMRGRDMRGREVL